MSETTATDDAWWYRDGTWHRGPRLVDWDAHPQFDTFALAAVAAGFDILTSTGNDEVHATALHIQVLVRHKPDTAWIVRIDAECAEEVYAPSLPDTMALLAQWAPTIQALNNIAPSSALTLLAHLAASDEDGYGPDLDAVIRRIAKAAR